jgi:hypothetical protein
MFYELNTWDPFGTTPWKRDTDEPLEGTFKGDTNIFAQIVEVVDPDADFAEGDEIGDASTQSALSTTGVNSTTINAADDDIGIQIPNLLPDG